MIEIGPNLTELLGGILATIIVCFAIWRITK